jgi:MFS family permease
MKNKKSKLSALDKVKLKNFNRALIIWLLGSLFFLVEYFIRISPSVITQDLMSQFKVSALALGGISTFYFIAYVIMQIPVGVLVDRYGARWLIVLATLLSAVGCVLFAISPSLWTIYLSRFFLGFGAAFAFVGTLKLVSNWFHFRWFAILAGATQSLGMLGAAIGDAPMEIVFHKFGWRESMIGIAILLFVLAVLMFFIIRDFPQGRKMSGRKKRLKVWPSLSKVLTNKQTWINGFYIGLLYGPTASFAGLWGVSFISVAYNSSLTSAAAEVGMVFIGLAIGCPLIGMMSEYFQSRLVFMRLSSILSFIILSIVIYIHFFVPGFNPSEAVWYVLLLLYGIVNSGIIPSYALASEVNKKEVTGMAIGFTNMASVIFGAIFIPVVGWIMDSLWAGKFYSAGAPVYTEGNYEVAFLLLPVCFVVSFVLTFFIKETHCKNIAS